MPYRVPLSERLVTVVTQNGITWHAYSIFEPRKADKKGDLALRIRDKLLTVAEEAGNTVLGPIVLSTNLDSGGAVVRDILRSHPGSEESLGLMQKVLDGKEHFHITIWWMPTGCADDKKLMRLH